MDYTVHGILQARILGWVAFPFSRGSSQPRDRNQVFHTAGGFFTSWAIREAQDLPDPGIEPGFTTLQMDSLQTELLGKSKFKVSTIKKKKITKMRGEINKIENKKSVEKIQQMVL